MTHDPNCLEGPGRTPEEMAENALALDAVAPTPADKFARMFGYLLAEDGVVVGKPKTAHELVRYWYEVSECVCSDPHPIGACLKCDMGFVLKVLDR